MRTDHYEDTLAAQETARRLDMSEEPGTPSVMASMSWDDHKESWRSNAQQRERNRRASPRVGSGGRGSGVRGGGGRGSGGNGGSGLRTGESSVKPDDLRTQPPSGASSSQKPPLPHSSSRHSIVDSTIKPLV